MKKELAELSKLLAISAGVARQIADVVTNNQDDISDLADQIDDVADALQVIAKRHMDNGVDCHPTITNQSNVKRSG